MLHRRVASSDDGAISPTVCPIASRYYAGATPQTGAVHRARDAASAPALLGRCSRCRPEAEAGSRCGFGHPGSFEFSPLTNHSCQFSCLQSASRRRHSSRYIAQEDYRSITVRDICSQERYSIRRQGDQNLRQASRLRVFYRYYGGAAGNPSRHSSCWYSVTHP